MKSMGRLLPPLEGNGVSLASIFGTGHMVSLYKQATFPTLQLVTGW